MTVRRIMGTEVEYGISVPGEPGVNPVITSSQVVLAYGARPGAGAPGPLGLRGGVAAARRPRVRPAPAPRSTRRRLADDDLGAANVILTNGARLYVDHAHPEFSHARGAPTRSTWCCDKAGERVMAEASRRAATIPGTPASSCTRTTSTARAPPTARTRTTCCAGRPRSPTSSGLTPFFASRQVVLRRRPGRASAGGRGEGFQLAQRADYIEVEVGLETTLKRGIINTRDEPHADADKYRRLHVIIGDANLAEIATYLKLGTAALVLSMIESGWPLPRRRARAPGAAVHQISHDPTLKVTVPLADGRRFTGCRRSSGPTTRPPRKYVEAEYGADVDEHDRRTCSTAGSACSTGSATDPMALADELDWLAKLRLLEGYREPRRAVLGRAPAARWSTCSTPTSARTRACTTGWSSRGSMKRLVTEEAVLEAMTDPPEDTRAYFRGRCVAQVRRPGGRGVLGLGDLRHRAGVAGADPDHGAAPGAPRRTSARCWTPRPTPPSWWMR